MLGGLLAGAASALLPAAAATAPALTAGAATAATPAASTMAASTVVIYHKMKRVSPRQALKQECTLQFIQITSV